MTLAGELDLGTFSFLEERMIRLRKMLPFAAVLLGAVLMGAPTPAHAAFSVRVYDDGVLQGGITVIPIGNNLIFFGSTTHFALTSGNGSSNNPGTPANANLALSNNETITSTFGTTGGTHSLRIEISQDGFLAPTSGALNLSSSGGGSIGYVSGTTPGATTTVTSTYQGFLDNTNALFGQPGAGSTPLQTATATRTTPGTAPLVYSPPVATNIVPGGTPFSITDVLQFTFTLSPGSGEDTANASFTTNAFPAAVPAPPGLVLALSSFPFLGIGSWLLRRRRAAQTAAV